MIRFKSVFLLILLLLFVNPVLAISYVDLERIQEGQLSIDYGYALELDGSNDRVTVPDSDSLDLTYGMTLSVWFMVTGSTGTGQYIIAKNNAYGLRIRNTNVWLDLRMKIEGLWVTASKSVVFEDLIGSWHHAVGFYNNGTLAVYLDMVVGLNGSKTGSIDVGTTPLEFGRRGTGEYYNGSVDESYVFNRPLNNTELTYLYNGGDGRDNALNSTGLVAHYHFNEGSGTSVGDETANNNDGTLSGDTDEWITGHVPIGDPVYPEVIQITNLEASYETKLYNSTNGLVCNGTANSQGACNLTLPLAYRSNQFEGTFRIYDTNASFVYSKWFEDIAGGDEYEAKTNLGSYTLGIIALVFGLCAITIVFARRL